MKRGDARAEQGNGLSRVAVHPIHPADIEQQRDARRVRMLDEIAQLAVIVFDFPIVIMILEFGKY